jgi:hypothetical protein
MTLIQMVMGCDERIGALEDEIAALKAALGNFLPKPAPRMNTFDPHAPRRTEPTTVNREVHPGWRGPKEVA